MSKKSEKIIHIDPIPTYLEWLDSSGFEKTGWREADKILSVEISPIKSIVYVLAENDEQIWTVGHIDASETAKTNYHGEMLIPKCTIVKRKRIKI